MNRTILASLAVAALTLASCNSSDTDKAGASAAAAPMTYEESASITASARVDAVDHGRRWIKLSDSYGDTGVFVVDPQVQRLNEVKVGDSVTATYTVALKAELRSPTADETAHPIMMTESAGRSPEGTDPAAGAHRGVRVVTTVEAVDLGKMHVKLKGPRGDTLTVRARKADNIKKLHVGDTVVVNYVETAVVSLVKATGR